MKRILGCLVVFFCLTSGAIAGSDVVTRESVGAGWPFSFDRGTLYCKDLDTQRKAVWINGADGYTYLLNGQSISWYQKARFKGANGKPPKEARKATNADLTPLIQAGLNLCN